LEKKIIIVVFIVFSFFIFGYTIGAEQIPFSKSVTSFYTTNLSDNSNLYEEIDPLLEKTNIESIIHLQNNNDITKKRLELIYFIWKTNSLPENMPTKVIQNFNDSRFSDMENLDKIDKIVVNMEYDIDSLAYLFHPVEKNNKLLIYHQGHAGDFIHGKNTISYYLERGYTIIAFSMPLHGLNSTPTLDIENFGVIKFDSHNKFRYLETKNFSPMKFFFHPILVSMNYIEKNHDFDTYDMIGLSGGAWTITLYSALDDRIERIFPVGGPLPLYIKENSNYDHIHYEVSNLALYKIANYLDFFILSSYGETKEHHKILNKFDSCCNYGLSYLTFENEVQNTMKKLGQGKFQIYLDETHREHKISDYALEIINNEIIR